MHQHENGSHADAAHHTPSNGHHANGSSPRSSIIAMPSNIQPDRTPGDADFDALADMFLDSAPGTDTHSSSGPTDTAGSSRRVPVTAMILGHLPVMASAWPAQHARVRAELTGSPVVIARLSRGMLSLEAIGCPPELLPASFDLSAADALAWTRVHAESVLIRVDEADEAALASASAIDRLVLLTGADDAAVVACYRKLKSLATAASQDRPMPPAQLTIVGASESRGQLAHTRITRAARAFLKANLLEPVVVDRIAPTGSQILSHRPTTLTPETLIAALHSAATDSPDIESKPPAEASNEHSASCAPELAIDAASEAVESSTPAPPQAPIDETLVAFVPGLLPLETRCPAAPSVALAYDAAGSLHLVAAALRDLPELSSAAPVPSLLHVRAWAITHAVLLGKAEPRLAADAAATAEMHFITDRPADARSLLETSIRVHLAAPTMHATHGLVTVSLDR